MQESRGRKASARRMLPSRLVFLGQLVASWGHTGRLMHIAFDIGQDTLLAAPDVCRDHNSVPNENRQTACERLAVDPSLYRRDSSPRMRQTSGCEDRLGAHPFGGRPGDRAGADWARVLRHGLIGAARRRATHWRTRLHNQQRRSTAAVVPGAGICDGFTHAFRLCGEVRRRTTSVSTGRHLRGRQTSLHHCGQASPSSPRRTTGCANCGHRDRDTVNQ